MKATIRLDFTVKGEELPTPQQLSDVLMNEVNNWDDSDGWRIGMIQFAHFADVASFDNNLWKHKYEESLKDFVTMREERDLWMNKYDNLKDDLDVQTIRYTELEKRLKAAESKAPGMWTRNESVTSMIGKVLTAFKDHGWDVGWGDDDQLANLEGSLDDIKTAAVELGDTLDEIRTER